MYLMVICIYQVLTDVKRNDATITKKIEQN